MLLSVKLRTVAGLAKWEMHSVRSWTRQKCQRSPSFCYESGSTHCLWYGN